MSFYDSLRYFSPSDFALRSSPRWDVTQQLKKLRQHMGGLVYLLPR